MSGEPAGESPVVSPRFRLPAPLPESLRQDAGFGGDDDLVGQQAVQLQQQGVGVLLVIRVEGRAQFLNLLLDEAKLWDDGALSVRFDGVQDGGDGDHRWIPFIAEKNGPACHGQNGGRGLARRAQMARRAGVGAP
jgi:hypothetical protein